MTQILDRGGRVARRLIDWIRWHGTTRTVLRGPAAGLRISTGNSSANYAEGTNELPVQHAVEELLRKGDTFFDIGANVGFFSLLAARRVGTHGKVVAFEVVPEIATTLEALLLRFGYAIEPMPPSYVGTDWHVLHLVGTKG